MSGGATYSVRVYCTNCGGPGIVGAASVTFPKGRPIAASPCPKCGVRGLKKGQL